MESTWGLANLLWGALIFGMVILFVNEARKPPKQKRYESQIAQERYEKERLSRKIVEVIPLGVSGTQFKRGGLGGMLFGGFMGGIPGAIVGAALRSGKAVPEESFAVKYGNGEVVVRKCMQGSSEYKALMRRATKE